MVCDNTGFLVREIEAVNDRRRNRKAGQTAAVIERFPFDAGHRTCRSASCDIRTLAVELDDLEGISFVDRQVGEINIEALKRGPENEGSRTLVLPAGHRWWPRSRRMKARRPLNSPDLGRLG